MKTYFIIISLSLISCLATSSQHKTFNPPLPMVVVIPVENVRGTPVPHSGRHEFDQNQETQVEMGEPVFVHQRQGEWALISAPEQLEFTHNNKWEGYPGWVRFSSLSASLDKIHTIQKLNLSEENQRENILIQARRHLGNPYLWGGRSIYDQENKQVATGVDCSGLVHWSYRQAGWFIPRDSFEQHLRARPLEPKNLKPADLIFLAKLEKPEKVVHVALYSGNGKMIEAPFTGENVREIFIKDRLGFPLAKLKNGFRTEKYVIYFGTFFPEVL